MSSILGVRVPDGVMPGQKFLAQAPNGQQIMATVPYGIAPGSIMYIRYQPIAPMPIAMGEDKKEEVESGDGDRQVTVVKGSKNTNMTGTPKQEDMIPFGACCCTILHCYLKCPECVGCYTQGVFTCCELETLCCKTGWGDENAAICLLGRGEAELIAPTTCCKIQEQLCCLNVVAAMPCDDEVPCMIGLCGITCVNNYQLVFEACKRMEEKEVKEGDRA